MSSLPALLRKSEFPSKSLSVTMNLLILLLLSMRTPMIARPPPVSLKAASRMVRCSETEHRRGRTYQLFAVFNVRKYDFSRFVFFSWFSGSGHLLPNGSQRGESLEFRGPFRIFKPLARCSNYDFWIPGRKLYRYRMFLKCKIWLG